MPHATGGSPRRDHLHVVADHHVADDHTVGPRDGESAPAEHDPVALTPGQATDFVAFVLPPLTPGDDETTRNALHDTLHRLTRHGGTFRADALADELYQPTGVELLTQDIAAALARAAATRP